MYFLSVLNSTFFSSSCIFLLCCFVCSCLPWHEVFYDLLDHVSNCLNDAKTQSIFPLLRLLHDVQQFKPGELVCVADVSINEVSVISDSTQFSFVFHALKSLIMIIHSLSLLSTV